MDKNNYPTIALGTWSWGKGMAGGDQVFGNNVGVDIRCHNNKVTLSLE